MMRRTMSPSVLVVGSVTIDHIGSAPRLGGVVTYAGATFARLGCRVAAAFRAPVGLPWIAEKLHSLGIEPLQQPSVHLTRFIHQMSPSGDRALQVPCRAAPIAPTEQSLAWARGAHLHLGPLHPDDLDPAWFDSRHAEVVSLDVQGLVRRIDPSGLVLAQVSPLAVAALRAASFVKASEEELTALLSHLRCDVLALLATHSVRELVVTRGDLGGYVLTSGGDRFEYAAARADGPVDATGAGDVFFASWLLERVHNDADPGEACRRAAQMAARQVSGHWLTPVDLATDSNGT